MYRSLRSLSEKYEISLRTAQRIYKRMLESVDYCYKKDYVKIGSLTRVNEESFLKAAGR